MTESPPSDSESSNSRGLRKRKQEKYVIKEEEEDPKWLIKANHIEDLIAKLKKDNSKEQKDLEKEIKKVSKILASAPSKEDFHLLQTKYQELKIQVSTLEKAFESTKSPIVPAFQSPVVPSSPFYPPFPSNYQHPPSPDELFKMLYGYHYNKHA
jgi:hypothetical protein